MEKEFSLGIYVPSYGRAKETNTFKFFDDCTYVVRKSQEEDYRKRGIQRIWAIDDSEIDNLCKVLNYINENAKEDVIFTIDDDVDYFLYRMERNEKIEDKELIIAEIERIAQIMVDLEIGFAAEDAAISPWNYSQEFTFKGTTGAMRWVNKSVYKSRFDEKVYHNCDLDVELHELLLNRIILQPKYFCVKSGTDTNSGGNSSKTRKQQEDCITEMKIRWGKHFKYNLKTNKPTINVKR